MAVAIYFEPGSGQIVKTATAAGTLDGDPGGVFELNTVTGTLYAEAPAGTDPARHYVAAYVAGGLPDGSGGVASIAPRPELPVIPASGARPLVIAMTAMPAGTTGTVRNPEGQVMGLTGDEDLALIEAGTYDLSLSPPFPWRPKSQSVLVTP